MPELDRLFKQYDQNDDQLEKLRIQSFLELIDLRRFIHNEIDELLSTEKIGLIVIDSLSSLIRAEPFSKLSGGRRRKNCIYQLGLRLKRIAMKYKLTIVHVNEVSAIVKKEENLGIKFKKLETQVQLWKTFQKTRFNQTMSTGR